MNIRRLATLSVFVFLSLPFSPAGPLYAQEPLLFGIHPYGSDRDIHERFLPIETYLGQQIGRPIKVVVTRNYEEQIDKMGKGKIDMAFMGPAPYIMMVDRYGEVPILGRLEINGSATFHGVIFVARDSPLRGLAHLRGKRFAFGDRNSTMSHLVPVYLLWKAGISVDQLGKYEFLGKHENVALGVLSGNFDAGAVREDVFSLYEKRGLRKLAQTPEFSGHVFVVRKKTPQKTVQALRKALFDLKNSSAGRTILATVMEGTTGVVAAHDNDYDSMREVLRQLERLGTK